MNALQMLKTIGWSGDSIATLSLSDTFEFTDSGVLDFNSDGTRFAKSTSSVHIHVYAMSESGFVLEEDIDESSASSVSYLGMSADGNVLAYRARYSGSDTVKIWERADDVWSQVASVPWYFTGDTGTPNLQHVLNLLPDKTGFLMQTYDAYTVETFEVYFYKKQASAWAFDRYSLSGPPSGTSTNRAIKPATQAPEYCVQFGWNAGADHYPVIYKKNASDLWEYTGIIASDAYGGIDRGSDDYAWLDNKLLLLRENASGKQFVGAYDPDTMALTDEFILSPALQLLDSSHLTLIPNPCSSRCCFLNYYSDGEYVKNLYITKPGSANVVESRILIRDNLLLSGTYLFDDRIILFLNYGTEHKIVTYTL